MTQQADWTMPAGTNVATEEERGEDFHGTPRDELLAAIREAGGTESASGELGEEEPAEAAPAVAPKPKAAPAAEEPAVEAPSDEPKIAAAIRAREEARRKVEEAQDQSARLLEQAQARARQIELEAQARAQAAYEAELEQRRKRFAESPTAAIRELGWKPDEMVDSVVREGTPEWKALRQLEARAAAAEAKADAGSKVAEEFKAFKDQLKADREAYERQQVEHQFLQEHAAPEKTPYLHKRYEPQQIVQEAHKLADKWSAAGIAFAHSDVAEYLEFEARKRIAGDASTPPQQVEGAAAKAAGKRPLGQANGTRTLSAASGSERRTSPKPLREMTPEEERDALIQEAREVRRKLGVRDE